MRTLDTARRILWFDELPGDFPGLRSFAGGSAAAADTGSWLTMSRVDVPDPPVVPVPLARWLDVAAVRDYTAEQAPELRQRPVDVADDAMDEAQRIGLRQAVEAGYEAWVRAWDAWAAERRRLDPAVRAYNELYHMAVGARQDAELFELVLAFGYATQQSGRDAVRRHVVTVPAIVAYDQRTGAVTVRPDPESPELILEEDMLDVGDRVPPVIATAIEELLKHAQGFEADGAGSSGGVGVGVDVDVDVDGDVAGGIGDETVTEPELEAGDTGLAALHRALKTWTNAAGPEARYQDTVSRHTPRYDRSPVVSFAPALVLRRRGARAVVQALRSISSLIEQTRSASSLIEFLIDPDAGRTTPMGDLLTDAGHAAGDGWNATGPDDVYFALPSNAEQTSIARRIRDERLVVVQGPPGTGKTHTIANLVTDLLAHGKRVLITSHTARALQVLRDKLPEELRPLCVSRTDDGVLGQQELEHSIKGILAQHGAYDSAHSAAEIKRLTDRLHAARIQQSEALLDLRTIREMDTFVYSADIGDYTGTPLQIAERLRREEPIHSWIGTVPEPDVLPSDTSAVTAQAAHDGGLTSAEAATLRTAALAYTPALAAVAGTVELPPAAAFPSPADFAQSVARIQEADQRTAALAGRHGAGLVAAVRALPDERRYALDKALDDFVGVRDRLAAHPAPWVAQARALAVAGQDHALRRRHEATWQALTDIRQYLPHVGPALISGLERFDLPTALHQAKILFEGLQAGQRLKGPLGMKTKLGKETEAFHETVRIDGAPLDTPQACLRVLYRSEIERRLLDTEQSWTGFPEPWGRIESRVGRLEDDLSVLDLLSGLAERYRAVVAAVAGSPELARLDWLDPAGTDIVREVLAADAGVRDTEAARRALAETAGVLSTWAAAQRHVPDQVAAAISALNAADPEGYRRAHTDVADLRDAVDARDTLARARAVVDARHPDLARLLEQTAADPVWDARIAGLPKAWAWARWNTRLAKLTDPDAERGARAALDEADGEVRLSLKRLAEARAWDHCLRRITAQQGRALQAYQLNIRKIGKGTGKHAYRYRAQARQNLREAQEAVPAWIMPLHQVVASVPMDRPELFDVVIVDEASQSGLEAVLLAHIAERMVVVGDDKQVSPSNVGLDQDQVFALQERMLNLLPGSLTSVVNPTTSLFDLASALAGGRGRLMLKEHFRCMPEIIDFSNRRFYGGELQPLRQFGTDRLPPLVTRYVADGAVEGTGVQRVNRAEAEALVDAVVACHEDPAYAGRSMGVITLLGGGQAALIEDLLAQRLSVAARAARGLRVGDAEAFQGDERQIMFLGMVVSRAAVDSDEALRIGGFSAESYQQRLNVAASRAQDQVQVFHSVHPGDLGPTDLRRAYLEYLIRPAAEQDAYLTGEVLPDVRRDPFDSLFEQRVYLALRRRGYRVRPQYPAGRYRIDLVVEGGAARLAVECDGDAFHGEQDAEADAARQRDLERVGWRFVRVRGSRFFRDPEAALEPLWEELEHLGIKPGITATSLFGGA